FLGEADDPAGRKVSHGGGMQDRPAVVTPAWKSLPDLPAPSILPRSHAQERMGGAMTPLEKIQSMKMPFAELKGVTFTEADGDRVVARMLVRPDLCTLHHTIHGGAVMALADSVGAAATVINLPEDAKGTT